MEILSSLIIMLGIIGTLFGKLAHFRDPDSEMGFSSLFIFIVHSSIDGLFDSTILRMGTKVSVNEESS